MRALARSLEWEDLRTIGTKSSVRSRVSGGIREKQTGGGLRGSRRFRVNSIALFFA